jgi:glycosyltransferase involved in cell wall biosynthesis
MLDPWSLQQKPVRKRIALRLGYRRMLDGAAFLHFLTDAERNGTTGLHLKSRPVVIPNGIFLEELGPLPQRGVFRAAHPEFADGKLILFLGRLHFKKGLDILGDAFAIVAREFSGAHLIVAGPDYGAREAFESQIARLGISSKVHLVGPLYGAEKIAAYCDCDCFCLPSRQEGFSLAIIEAMACEAPVVITPECHFPEVAGAGAGVIVGLNAIAVAGGISTILRDASGARKMGENGRGLVVGRYTWEKVAKEMVDGYQRIVRD